ncbi:response regulator [Cupriavidus sp. TA19]|uniref:response regulator n=1 Tax=Cupriavidus sp. TA19 TaxID=701108 RepID=UPI00398C17B5
MDDHVESGESLTFYLRTQGIDTKYVDSGDAAIALAEGWAPHMVILDITMPIRDGYSTAAALRRSKRGSDVIILALTALDEAQVRRHGAGFDAYCQKGTKLPLLLTLLASFVASPAV